MDFSNIMIFELSKFIVMCSKKQYVFVFYQNITFNFCAFLPEVAETTDEVKF